MIPYNLADLTIYETFLNAMIESTGNEKSTFAEFRAFYENDFSEIEEYIKDTLEDTYDKKTLDYLRIRHKDIIQKILRQKVAGIFDNEPIRKLILNEEGEDGKELEWDGLSEVLSSMNYNRLVKEALKSSLFFNVIAVQIVNRNGKTELETWTPDVFDVTVNKNDYLKADAIYYPFYDSSEDKLYIVYWDEDEHYLIDGSGNKITEWDGEKLANNYKTIPFTFLRIRKGWDFYGEPNWNLLQTQKEFDIDLTNLKLTFEYQSFGVWIGENIPDKDDIRISPNAMIRTERNDINRPGATLQNVKPNVSFTDNTNLVDWDLKTTLMSEGLSGASSDVQARLESGVSKGYDEMEMQIQRDDLKNLMYYFEIELLNKLRIVWNIDNPDNPMPEGTFDIYYSEEKPAETVADKKQRREMEKNYGIRNEIDFAVEDLEVSREEAVAIVAKNFGYGEEITEEELIQNLNSKNVSSFASKLRGLNVSNQSQV
jgi:hypothetical protein